ncbi:hypothetical protein PINS_up011556 [Pythium insidiosum]|nr:hypothetical protein PINS_up011556 [Pythium insidiosum]
MPWLRSRPNVRDLSLWSIVGDSSTNDSAVAAAVGDTPERSWPPIESLTCDQYSRELLPLLERSGASLRHLSIASSLNDRDVDVVKTLMSHCTRLDRLDVCGVRREFVDALSSSSSFREKDGNGDDDDDGCGLWRLRELTIRSDRSRSMAFACVRLLQVLSDPSQRLTQSLQSLKLVVCKAVQLMLRCNHRIVSVYLDRTYSGLEDDEQQQQHQSRTDWSDSEDDLEPLENGVGPASSAILNNVIVAAKDKAAIPLDGVVRGVVSLPTARARAAFLSVLAARGLLDCLPPAVVMHALMMTGRPAFRRFLYTYD